MKPRIYWTYYPLSRRGYWRVSPMPRPIQAYHHTPWAFAHRMAAQMNEVEPEFSNCDLKPDVSVVNGRKSLITHMSIVGCSEIYEE